MHKNTVEFLLGPHSFNSRQPINKTDPFSLEPLNVCASKDSVSYIHNHQEQFIHSGCFSYTDRQGNVWGFDTSLILQHLNNSQRNPYTRKSIPKKDIYRAMCLKFFLESQNDYSVVHWMSNLDGLTLLDNVLRTRYRVHINTKFLNKMSYNTTLRMYFDMHTAVDATEFFNLYILDGAILHRDNLLQSDVQGLLSPLVEQECPVKTVLYCELLRIITSSHPRKLDFIYCIKDIFKKLDF